MQLLYAGLKIQKRNTGSDLAAVQENRVDAAVFAVVPELDGLFTVKEEQRTVLKAFLRGNNVFTLLPTGFGQSSVKYCSALRPAMGQQCVPPNVTTHTNRKARAVVYRAVRQ